MGIEWGESLSLVLSWCGYIVVLVYNNKGIKLCVNLMSWMGLSNAEEMLYEQLKHSHQQQDKRNMNERIPIAIAQNGDNYDEEDDMDHSRHFIAMELEERDTEQLKMQIREQQQHNLPRILRKAPKIAH